jgi:glucose/arabinose dehydrogenase
MRRVLAGLTVAALLLSACARADESTRATLTPATSRAPTPTKSQPDDAAAPQHEARDGRGAIRIEISGDRIRPNGARVAVPAGEPVLLEVESDRAAELHVHSSPEQVLAVPRGGSVLRLSIDRPGIVDVEEHHTGIVVVQLEVR